MARLEGILGTGNAKKVVELRDLFAFVGVEWKSLSEVPDAIDVDETGATFAENARLKACEQAAHLKAWVLAEDSGLLVDALDGEPGVLSARYAGTHGDDAANNRLLLEKLGDLPLEKRTAQFVCYMVLADPAGNVRAESQGRCRGRIVFAPRGSSGFGYDPLFEIPEYRKTMAELGLVVKSALSHRAGAARAIIPQLVHLVDSGEWTRALGG
ncbi:MAG: RdgB/HAM1 family non-canonical purine NTP pyrophosphatase [Planctomycetota bacterium]|nr:MAG: RdgB/HAM1 family non-canonical purine NTP pyrophosphatase [Planctomycetota bacterium]